MSFYMDLYKDILPQLKNDPFKYSSVAEDTQITSAPVPIDCPPLDKTISVTIPNFDCSGQPTFTTTTQPVVNFNCIPYSDDNAANEEEVVVENVMKTPNGLLLLYKNGKTQFIPNKDILTLDKPKN